MAIDELSRYVRRVMAYFKDYPSIHWKVWENPWETCHDNGSLPKIQTGYKSESIITTPNCLVCPH